MEHIMSIINNNFSIQNDKTAYNITYNTNHNLSDKAKLLTNKTPIFINFSNNANYDNYDNFISNLISLNYFIICKANKNSNIQNSDNLLILDNASDDFLYEIIDNCKYSIFFENALDKDILLAITTSCKHIFIMENATAHLLKANIKTGNIFYFDSPDKLIETIKIINEYNTNIIPSSIFTQKGFCFFSNDKLYRTADINNNLIFYKEKFTPYINKISSYNFYNLYEVEKIPFFTFYQRWSNLQRKDIIKKAIDYNIELLQDNKYLHDAHFLNLTFKYCQPIYFDFDSVFNVSNNIPYCLHIYYNILNNINSLLSSAKNFDYQISKYNSIFFNAENENTSLVISKLREIKSFIDDFYFEKDISIWTNYCKNIPLTLNEYIEASNTNPRTKFILDNLIKYKPKTVFDFGANTGYYSLLAELLGSEVFAVDNINDVIDSGYHFMKPLNKKITFAIMNLTEIDYPARTVNIYERLQAEFGIASAIEHHLSRAGMTFEQQADLFNKFCSKYLFVEFIPKEDAHINSWNLFPNYNLDNYIKALSKYFKIIEIGESAPFPRKCIMCEKL